MKFFQLFILSMAIVLISADDDSNETVEKVDDDKPLRTKFFPLCEKLPERRENSSRASFPDDGCEDYSVRFKKNGYCYPILKQGPCPSIYQWVTVDPYTYEGRCSPRLCGRNRVFVECTGKCHDMNDKDLCRGGRRLFYSAYGSPVCDCPVGQYPFPKEDDDCVPLFTQGPCPDNEVVTPTSSGKLKCQPNVCKARPKTVDDFILQWFPRPNGDDNYDKTCFAMGTVGPCYSKSKVLGYNIFERRGECVDLEDPAMPYYISEDLDDKLDKAYKEDEDEDPEEKYTTTPKTRTISRASRIKHKKRVVPINNQNSTTIRRPKTSRASRIGRQTFGSLQTNNNYGSSSLVGCQQGNRYGYNYKCSNPVVPDRPKRDVVSPSSSAYGCNANDRLNYSGNCRTQSCPSRQTFDSRTGRCVFIQG